MTIYTNQNPNLDTTKKVNKMGEAKKSQHWINRENPYIAREIDRTHEIYECREAKKVWKK